MSRAILLTGSVGLDSAEEVFRTLGRALGTRAPRLPDGETGYARSVWIQSQAPFFLEVTYNAAHWPFQVPDHPSVAAGHGRFVQPEENDTATRQDYIAILERADQGIGRILQALKRQGLDRNTLVIYMQDNGGEWSRATRRCSTARARYGKAAFASRQSSAGRDTSRRAKCRARSASFRM